MTWLHLLVSVWKKSSVHERTASLSHCLTDPLRRALRVAQNERLVLEVDHVDEAEHKVELAQARLLKYKQQKEEQKSLYEQGKINKYQLNELQKRTARLQRNTEKELDSLSSQLNQTEVDSSGQALVIFRWKYWTSEKWSCLIWSSFMR